MGKTKVNLTKEQFDTWLADLRSGNFKQGHDRLKAVDVNDVARHCCLGVLGERLDLLMHDTYGNWKCPTSSPGDEALFLPWDVIDMDTQKTVAKMNDELVSFPDIADHIEKNMEPASE
jgi:hypothetical protein